MGLSVAIMAHESRRHLFEPLGRALATQTEQRVVAYIDSDSAGLGRWGNGRRCLLSYGSDASHHLVIQDDAVPAADLIAGIEAWLPHLPNSILCLYSGRVKLWRRIHARHAQPPCWLQAENLQWGVATVWPTDVLEQIVKRGDQLDRIPNFDMRAGVANRLTHKLPVLYPSPSFVDHAETPSTVPGRSATRHALHALTAEQSVFDWAPIGQAPIIPVPDFVRRPAGQQYYIRGV